MDRRLALALAFPAALIAAGQAHANPTRDTAQGRGRAVVVPPMGIVAVEDLRFGQFFRPASNGQVIVSETGTVTAQGGMTGMINTAQFGTGRGPGTFLVRGDPNRRFTVNLPNQIDITRGAATMRVFQFRSNVPNGIGARLDATGTFLMRVGARLQVRPNQAYGEYRGTFPMTVTYQ